MKDKRDRRGTETKFFENIRELSEAACGAFRSRILKSEDRYVFLALSGGHTPKVVYRRLAEEPYKTEIPWERIHFFWGDERCVPPGHPESNYGMAAENLLNRVSVPAENIHRIVGENRPDDEAARYEEEIKSIVPLSRNGIPRFDWILLGLGSDGHTSSLFPGTRALKEKERYCVAAVHPESGIKRITCTLPLINNAALISFFVTGKEKAQILSDILRGKEGYVHCPAAMVKPSVGLLEWWTDIKV